LTIGDGKDLARCDVTQRPTKDDVQSHSYIARIRPALVSVIAWEKLTSTSERDEERECNEGAHDFE